MASCSSVAEETVLPPTCEALNDCFSKEDIAKLMAGKRLKNSRKQMVVKYSCGGLSVGRPLNQLMIVLFGETGAGKSSTVNCLYDDPGLCSTSGSSSETKHVTQYVKKVRIGVEDNNAIIGEVCIVDTPATSDTDSTQEAANLSQVSSFRNEVLCSRSKTAKIFGQCRKKVYPNIVLFTIDATDKRMDGPDSGLAKALRCLMEHDFVDLQHNNLIVVVTNALSLSSKRDVYLRKITAIREVVLEQVKKFCNAGNVPIIFLDNKAEEYTSKDPYEDFYELPDGEFSHFNLFEAIDAMLSSNRDLLGQLISGYYFGEDVPEKRHKAREIVFHPNPDIPNQMTEDEACRILGDLNISHGQPSSQAPPYNLQPLGCGYCPVTECDKYRNLIPDEAHAEVVEVLGKKFLVPSFVVFNLDNNSDFKLKTFDSKESYEAHRSAGYGLEAGVQLVVSVGSNGHWIQDNARSSRSSDMLLVYQHILGHFTITNPHVLASEDLKTAVKRLPMSHSDSSSNSNLFNEFFAEWGTHVTYQQNIGGLILCSCSIKASMNSQDNRKAVEMSVGCVFEGYGGSVDGGHQLTSAKLQELGITSQSLNVCGGSTDGLLSLRDLTPTTFKDWAASVKRNPSPLKYGTKVIPYYQLDCCKDSKGLREATLAYLGGNLISKEIPTRNEAPRMAVLLAVAEIDHGGCFPAFTNVLTDNGVKAIDPARQPNY